MATGAEPTTDRPCFLPLAARRNLHRDVRCRIFIPSLEGQNGYVDKKAQEDSRENPFKQTDGAGAPGLSTTADEVARKAEWIVISETATRGLKARLAEAIKTNCE